MLRIPLYSSTPPEGDVIYWRGAGVTLTRGFQVSVQLHGDDGDRAVAVDARVRVYPGTERESRGEVVEDFGESVADG